MPKTIISWTWEEAFDRHGFGDGDSWNGTRIVVDKLAEMGFEAEAATAGLHNYCIWTVKAPDGAILEFDDDQDPRETLPPEVVAALDTAFGDEYTVEE